MKSILLEKIGDTVNGLLIPLGYRLAILNTTLGNHSFKKAVKKATKISVISPEALWHIWSCIKATEDLRGSIVEIGVYKGGSLKLMEYATKKVIYGFDTFEGMPKETKEDNYHKKGDFSVEFKNVKRAFSNNNSVNLVKGLFNKESILPEIISFGHIDVDLYSSTKVSLEKVYDRLCEGGLIIVDDYGFRTTKGARKAVKEFLHNRKIIGVELNTGQFLIQKNSSYE